MYVNTVNIHVHVHVHDILINYSWHKLYTCTVHNYAVMLIKDAEERKKQARSYKQQGKANTPKVVTFHKKNELPGLPWVGSRNSAL